MTRAGMTDLLALLSGQGHAQAFDGQAWRSLLDVTREENVLPLAAHRLAGSSVRFTPEQSAELAPIQRKAHFSSFIWVETLRNVLAAFHAAGLAVIPLKGPVLAERLYGDPALRSYADLDLLVQIPDLAAAEQALTAIGFVPTASADDYHQPWARNSIHLELHHHVDHPLAFDFDLKQAWDRAEPSQYAEIPIQLFAPQDELAYLCLHAVRHRFDRLCLLVDLGFAFRKLSLQQSGEAASHSTTMRHVIALSWMMAAKLDPDIPVLPQGFTTSNEYTRLSQLADRVWQEHMNAPAAKLDWAAQHRFLLEIESPGRSRMVRRWRHLRILATRVIDADLEFAARLHLRRRWQAWLLRPIRLLTQAVRPKASTANVEDIGAPGGN